MNQCDICSATVRELRRGRCWGCYSRWVDARPVGLGAACRFCGERRRSHLKSVELLGAWVPTCHNCAARMGALAPLPRSVAGIREALTRERRGPPRRLGKSDDRVFPYERRDEDRRRRLGRGTADAGGPGEPAGPAPVDDEMILEIAELAEDLEALACRMPGEAAGSDLTLIRQVPGDH
jgi:hypothetical protein